MVRIFFLFFLPFFTTGCTKNSDGTENVKATLISEVESIQPGQEFWMGIHLKIKRGWHTYWKNPGESGMATKVRWTLPPGFSAGKLQWPVPERFEDSAGISYGYKESVLLPVKITPPANLNEGQKIPISAEVHWLECKDLCLPGKAEMRVVLPVLNRTPKKKRKIEKLFSSALQKLPTKDLSWTLELKNKKEIIELIVFPSDNLEVKGLQFFPEKEGIIREDAPQKFYKRNGRAVLELSQPPNSTAQFLQGVLLITKERQTKAIEVNLKIN